LGWLRKNYISDEQDNIKGNIDIKFVNFKKLLNSNCGRWIMRQTGLPILFAAIFAGDYKSGVTHIDMTASYNFYFMLKGRKDVLIGPKGFEKYTDMAYGIHNVYVKNEKKDSHHIDKMEWLKELPYYYRFELQENEILVFNNAACLHKFVNITENNVALTCRTMNMFWGISELNSFNMLTNMETVKTATEAIINNGSNEPANKYSSQKNE